VPLPTGEEPVVDANVGATAGGTSVGVTVTVGTEPDAGVQVGDTVIGTAPEVPTSDGVTATIDPIGSDPIGISLP
jgi:hypothetical protein